MRTQAKGSAGVYAPYESTPSLLDGKQRLARLTVQNVQTSGPLAFAGQETQWPATRGRPPPAKHRPASGWDPRLVSSQTSSMLHGSRSSSPGPIAGFVPTSIRSTTTAGRKFHSPAHQSGSRLMSSTEGIAHRQIDPTPSPRGRQARVHLLDSVAVECKTSPSGGRPLEVPGLPMFSTPRRVLRVTASYAADNAP